MKKIGIISGNGRFPFIVAEYAVRKGYAVCVCAVKGETDPSIADVVARLEWIKLGELKKLVSFFQSEGITEVCFAGKITKTSLFSGRIWPDFDMIRLFASTRDRKDDTLLGSICHYLEEKGIHVIDSTLFLEDCMPPQGLLTKRSLSSKEQEDVAFGWEIAKEMGRLDIGQSVIVKDKAVMAVEAIEGTDEAIKRGALLGNGNVVVIKVAKPSQDMRFDVPTIGVGTIQSMIDAHARVLAFEAGKTICIDLGKMQELANRHHITIVAV